MVLNFGQRWARFSRIAHSPWFDYLFWGIGLICYFWFVIMYWPRAMMQPSQLWVVLAVTVLLVMGIIVGFIGTILVMALVLGPFAMTYSHTQQRGQYWTNLDLYLHLIVVLMGLALLTLPILAHWLNLNYLSWLNVLSATIAPWLLGSLLGPILLGRLIAILTLLPSRMLITGSGKRQNDR
jgi:hypothetical protein